MRLDKFAYLGLICVTSIIIVIVVVLGNYGFNISKDPSFLAFFKWYIFLFVINLLNILITLIFHYMMADIPGVNGLKGFIGDKGLPGDNEKCFCTKTDTTEKPDDDDKEYIDDLDITEDIKTRIVNNLEREAVGTVIYHDSNTTDDGHLVVGDEL